MSISVLLLLLYNAKQRLRSCLVKSCLKKVINSAAFSSVICTIFSTQKQERPVLQPLRWCCVDCVIHHERDMREELKYMYVARTSNSRVISSGDLYCCLLSRCEALRTCHSGFPIATPAYGLPRAQPHQVSLEFVFIKPVYIFRDTITSSLNRLDSRIY